MKKKSKFQLTILNIILLMLSTVLMIITINFYQTNSELNKEIEDLKKEIEIEKEHIQIYEGTKKFIELLAISQQKEMLTGKAYDDYIQALENSGKEENYHGTNTVDKIEILNAYGVKTEKHRGESYAIFRIYYSFNPAIDQPMVNQHILTLSLHAKWEKVNNEYKVYDYEFHALKDSLDEYLRKSTENETESEGK